MSTKIHFILNNEQYNNILIPYTVVLTRVVVFVVNLLRIDWFLFLTCRTHIVKSAIRAFHCRRVPSTAAKKKWFVWSLLEATQNFARFLLDFIFFFNTNSLYAVPQLPPSCWMNYAQERRRETMIFHTHQTGVFD